MAIRYFTGALLFMLVNWGATFIGFNCMVGQIVQGGIVEI